LSLVDQGRAREAESFLRESLKLRRAALPGDHWLIASSEQVLGSCLFALHRYRDAEPLLLHAHRGLAATVGETHERTLDTRKSLIALYEAWDKPQLAREWRAELEFKTSREPRRTKAGEPTASPARGRSQ
jgi:hypothetical protein